MTVNGITTAIAVAAGYKHACARLQGGAVRCWGANDGAEPVRHFEMRAEQTHGEWFGQARMTTGLNAMASAGASKGFNAPNLVWDHRPGAAICMA